MRVKRVFLYCIFLLEVNIYFAKLTWSSLKKKKSFTHSDLSHLSRQQARQQTSHSKDFRYFHHKHSFQFSIKKEENVLLNFSIFKSVYTPVREMSNLGPFYIELCIERGIRDFSNSQKDCFRNLFWLHMC